MKVCTLLSYSQFIIIIGLKTDSLFKGASSGAQWPVVQYTALKKRKKKKEVYPIQVNISTENLSKENL